MEFLQDIQQLLNEVFSQTFLHGIISNPRQKDGVKKMKIRPILLRDVVYIQSESFTKTQAFHENLLQSEAAEKLSQKMTDFQQMELHTSEWMYHVLISKKGKVTVKRKKQTQVKEANLSHNQQKKYLLAEGSQVPFLQDLGVMTCEGKVVHAQFDKFRQINRFLEFVEDILPQLEKSKEVTILDFGCGKSYLTFALYHYLHEMQGYDLRIIGLDLKKEVIEKCNQLANKYGYEKLQFQVGDIAQFEGVNQVDMVVTLHACDTATDYALAKAIAWNAKVILSVPCCQHELNAQVSCKTLSPILSYGLLKERFASLVTDGLRAKYLEQAGYETQVLEFIDMEHTPKNILLRAVYTGKVSQKAKEEIDACQTLLQVHPTLGELLKGMDA
jgi:SAM-dependent methyltransferase